MRENMTAECTNLVFGNDCIERTERKKCVNCKEFIKEERKIIREDNRRKLKTENSVELLYQVLLTAFAMASIMVYLYFYFTGGLDNFAGRHLQFGVIVVFMIVGSMNLAFKINDLMERYDGRKVR